MAERLGLRLRFFLFFALIGVGGVIAIAGACWYLGQRIEATLLADLVLAGGGAAFAVLGLSLWVWLLFDEHVARPIVTLANEVRAGVHADSDDLANRDIGRYLGILAPTLRDMMAALSEARQHNRETIQAATAEAEQQKRRLETVLQDLQQGVVICNLDHQVMLYNRRALAMLQGPMELGLGRSVLKFVAPQPLRHALERLHSRFSSGRYQDHRDGLSTLIVATTDQGHQQLRMRIALILDPALARPLGYVMSCDDVTDELAAGIWRDRLLQDVTSDMRQRVANLALAGEVLGGQLTVANDEDRRLRAILNEEPQILAERLQRLDEAANDLLAGAWPMNDVLSATVLSCARDRQSEGRDLQVEIVGEPLWLHCDSAAIVEMLDRLLNRVAIWAGVTAVELYSDRGQERAYLGLRWTGQPVPNTVLTVWLAERLDDSLGGMTVQDVLQRHRTELWSQGVADGQAVIRLPLNLAEQYYHRPLKSPPIGERPAFYDFDLLDRQSHPTLNDTPLRALTLVVFDTETTGLEPSRGDEIISIAGVRIVNGRLLSGEVFNNFVHPGRRIPQASTKIHGISDDMVQDADPVSIVLPRFHAFVGDAVLVAHNAAFDMKFLSLKQDQAQVRFEQPVLDTVLLAAHLFGTADSLTLDALAQRFQVEIAAKDRHTALGDALATAQVLLKLMDLLPAAGVSTLSDALAVSEKQVAIRRQQSGY